MFCETTSSQKEWILGSFMVFLLPIHETLTAQPMSICHDMSRWKTGWKQNAPDNSRALWDSIPHSGWNLEVKKKHLIKHKTVSRYNWSPGWSPRRRLQTLGMPSANSHLLLGGGPTQESNRQAGNRPHKIYEIISHNNNTLLFFWVFTGKCCHPVCVNATEAAAKSKSES